MSSICVTIAVAQAVGALLGGGVPMHIGEPVVSTNGVEITIDAPVSALRHVERHVLSDRIVLFVPGVAAASRARPVATGPLALLKVREVELGVAITLVPRGAIAAAAQRLEIVTGIRPAIRLASLSGAASRGDASSNHAATSSPANDGSALSPSSGTRVAAAPARFGVAGTSRTSAVPTMALIGMAMLALAAIAWWVRRGRTAERGTSTIQVLAVRAIGPKQKLMMVDTGTERFLLATSDKDVHLLSTLSGGEGLPANFASSLADAAQDPPGPDDVSGLIRLRDRHGPTHGVAA